MKDSKRRAGEFGAEPAPLHWCRFLQLRLRCLDAPLTATPYPSSRPETAASGSSRLYHYPHLRRLTKHKMQAATLKATVFSASLQQRARLGRPQQRALVVRATAGKEEPSLHEKLAGPAAALLGAALLFAATPDEALAARSGGRVGGSSGFSSRAATRAAAPRCVRQAGPAFRIFFWKAKGCVRAASVACIEQ